VRTELLARSKLTWCPKLQVTSKAEGAIFWHSYKPFEAPEYSVVHWALEPKATKPNLQIKRETLFGVNCSPSLRILEI
jgi:hypothetical protein